MIQVQLDSNLTHFLREVSPYLENHPSIHSFLISLITRLERGGRPAALAVRGIDRHGKLVMAGLQTEFQYPLVISIGTEIHAAEFAKSLAGKISALPGVNGPLSAASSFAESWKAEKNCALKIATNLRLFELTEVLSQPKPSGFSRAARLDEVELIFKWLDAFHEEAVSHDPKPSAEHLRYRIHDSVLKGNYFIWEDQARPVCLVGSGRETSIERWIAPVYTPPALRGKGYATALVHDVSRMIIDSGKNSMLFTDLGNATSNSIYPKVGYRPLADFRHVLFQ